MNDTLPQTIATHEELNQLTRWSKVALAARGARLVVSVVDRFWTDAPEKHKAAIVNAVSVAETLAKEAGGSASYAANSGRCAMAFYEAKAAAHAARKASKNEGLYQAALASAYAAKTAAYYANEVDDISNTLAAALSAAEFFSVADKFHVVLRDLYLQLLEAGRTNNWTNNTAVSPEFFQNNRVG